MYQVLDDGLTGTPELRRHLLCRSQVDRTTGVLYALSDQVSCRGGFLLTVRGRRGGGVDGWPPRCLLAHSLTVRIGRCHDRFAALHTVTIIESD